MTGKRKAIFITGAASGIGLATARQFAGQGWFVGLYDINGSALPSLHSELGREKSCYQSLDVTDEKSFASAVKHFAVHSGKRMDVLFNNAGIIRMGKNERIPLSQQKLVIDINVCGILTCIAASLHLLKSTKGSRIINMSSASSLAGVPELAVYAASKAAVGSLTESLNLELEKEGIFVCDVRAPYVKTPLLDREERAASVKKLGIRLSPQDVADVVWKAAHGRRVHNDTKGILPLRALLTLPGFIRRPIMKSLTM